MRVSAIITAYNGEPFIREAITSVLKQTRPVDEIVVVDDGSTDGTIEIVSEYPQIRLVQQANKGPGAARNLGVAETTGELIAFLDCDDIWLPDKTERQVSLLETHADALLVTGDKWWWNVPTNEKWLFDYPPHKRANIKREIVFQNLIGNPSMTMIRRRAFNQVGCFDPSIRWGQDWELWLRLVEAGPMCFDERPVIIYRWHEDNLSHQNGWLRLKSYYRVQVSGIRRLLPLYQRPLAHLRVLSHIEMRRATHAQRLGLRGLYLLHATFALCSFPFERVVAKLGHFLRAIIGDQWYQRFKGAGSSS